MTESKIHGQNDWNVAIHYNENKFYKVQIEKTLKEFILRIFTENGELLKESRVDLNEVWNKDHEEYFALGDPHSNYYQGSFKIKEISMQY